MSKNTIPVISKKDLPAPSRRHRYYTPDEVKVHNSANDCYVSIFYDVYDLTKFIQENYSDLMEPLIKAAGTDISHWFDPKTGDPKTCVLPGTSLLSYYAPNGLYPNIVGTLSGLILLCTIILIFIINIKDNRTISTIFNTLIVFFISYSPLLS